MAKATTWDAIECVWVFRIPSLKLHV